MSKYQPVSHYPLHLYVNELLHWRKYSETKMCFIFRRQLQQQLVCLKKLKTVAEVSFYNLTERERPGERGRWQQTADSAPVIQTVVLARRGKVKTRTHATSQHIQHIHITLSRHTDTSKKFHPWVGIHNRISGAVLLCYPPVVSQRDNCMNFLSESEQITSEPWTLLPTCEARGHQRTRDI